MKRVGPIPLFTSAWSASGSSSHSLENKVKRFTAGTRRPLYVAAIIGRVTLAISTANGASAMGSHYLWKFISKLWLSARGHNFFEGLSGETLLGYLAYRAGGSYLFSAPVAAIPANSSGSPVVTTVNWDIILPFRERLARGKNDRMIPARAIFTEDGELKCEWPAAAAFTDTNHTISSATIAWSALCYEDDAIKTAPLSRVREVTPGAGQPLEFDCAKATVRRMFVQVLDFAGHANVTNLTSQDLGLEATPKAHLAAAYLADLFAPDEDTGTSSTVRRNLVKSSDILPLVWVPEGASALDDPVFLERPKVQFDGSSLPTLRYVVETVEIPGAAMSSQLAEELGADVAQGSVPKGDRKDYGPLSESPKARVVLPAKWRKAGEPAGSAAERAIESKAG